MSLNETLKEYSKSNIYPFHMPGHKRMLDGCYKIDMTEVEGVDNLHHPESVIKNEQIRLARLYGAKESLMLVGGSTVGNISAIYACCQEGDTIVIQRNSHKSVYNGAIIRHLKVEYIEPHLDENCIYHAVTVDMVKSAISIHSPKAIVLTTPSYEGYHCNIEEIGKICHDNGVILIVDQAHGAHLGFHEEFKHSAVGHADITVQSLHKTLPCLTQTAAIHISGDTVDTEKVKEAIEIFETSSPSYVLMDSISVGLNYLEKSVDLFRDYVDKLRDFYEICGKLNHLKIVNEASENKDIGKIVISTKEAGITGVELAKKLREEYEIETELSSFTYVLAMTSVMDSKAGFERLKKALLEIDEGLTDKKVSVPTFLFAADKIMEPYEAKNSCTEKVKLEAAIGRISSGMICLYPPGVPVIVPGEKITEDGIRIINRARQANIEVTGITLGCISVVK